MGGQGVRVRPGGMEGLRNRSMGWAVGETWGGGGGQCPSGTEPAALSTV